MRDPGSERPFFTFVIPAHNLSGCIGRCLDSILTQPFKSVEAIVVDDASEDDTAAIAEKYAETDPRVRVIAFEDNMSSHCARYDGVMASSGEYVWMVDGDDEVSPGACEEIHDILEKDPVDILHFGAEVINDGSLPRDRVDGMRRFVTPYDGALEGRDILTKCFSEKAYRFNVWNKVFDGAFCKRCFESMEYRPLPKTQDEYEYFVLAYHAGSYLGVPGKQFYRYHFGNGITGHNTLDLKQFERYCTIAMTLDAILEFSERASMPDEYGPMLKGIEYQLFDDCYGNWINNVPQELKGKGMDLMMDYWGDSRAIGLIARKNWIVRGPIARIAASSERMIVPGHDVKTVATFYRNFKNGGIQRVMSGMMDVWTSLGYKVVLITDDPPSDDDYHMPEGVVREVIPSAEITTIDNYSERSEALADVLRKHSVDAIVYHAWVSNLMLWDMMTCKSCGVSFVVHCHTIFSMPVMRLLEYFAHLQPTMSLCDGMVVLSEVDERYWSSFNDNVHQVVNPFSYDPNGVQRSRLDSNTVLWVGRMSDEKRPLDALKVMREVLTEVPDAKLVVLGGGNDEMMKSLEKLADELGIRDSVALEGFKLDVLPYYQQASVFLGTSEFEGYGMTFTEALSVGVPVVTYELPYLTITRMGLGVVQVPRRDVKSAAREIVRILRDEEYRNSLSEQALECVERLNSFDFEAAWSNIFDSLSDTRVPKRTDGADTIMWSTLAEHYVDGIYRNRAAVKKLTDESRSAEKKRAEEERKRKEAEREVRKRDEERKKLDDARKKADRDRIEASVSDFAIQRKPSSPWEKPQVTIVVEITGGYECTLDSVLLQTFRGWKCVVVSESNPSPVLARYGQYGVASAESIDEAVRSANTPYVAVLSSSAVLDRRFIGEALNRLSSSAAPAIVCSPSNSPRSKPFSLDDIGSMAAVMKSGTSGFKDIRPTSTALISETSGVPNGASGHGEAERGSRISFLLDCSECEPRAAEEFLESMPEWGELVCFNVPAGEPFKNLRTRWADRRLTVMSPLKGRAPICAVACCCDSPDLVVVDPSSLQYGREFFEAALEAAECKGRIVPDYPAIQEAIGSSRTEGWAFDPYSTILRRSEIVAGEFESVSGPGETFAVARYAGLGPDGNRVSPNGTDPCRVPAMRRVCPICNGMFEHLLSSRDGKRAEARCPKCDSLERHRAVDMLMRRTIDTKFERPRVLYVSPTVGIAPYLKERGIECMEFDEVAETTWKYDGIVLCHLLQAMNDHEGVVKLLGSRLSEQGTLYITVPLKKMDNRVNMIERIKIDVFELMDVVSRHGMDPTLLWVRDAFCPNTVKTRSLGGEAVIMCKKRA